MDLFDFINKKIKENKKQIILKGVILIIKLLALSFVFNFLFTHFIFSVLFTAFFVIPLSFFICFLFEKELRLFYNLLAFKFAEKVWKD